MSSRRRSSLQGGSHHPLFADSGGRGIEGASFTTGEETKGESTARELTSEEEMRWRPHSALTGDFGWGRKDLQEKKKQQQQQQRQEQEAHSRKLSTSSSIPSQKPSPSKSGLEATKRKENDDVATTDKHP